jgi:apolipoprotein N-acyltransferase
MQLDAKMARLAGLGGYAVAVGVVVAFAGFVWLVRPVRYGGINPITSDVAMIAIGVVCAMLIAAHVAIGNQLLAAARR